MKTFVFSRAFQVLKSVLQSARRIIPLPLENSHKNKDVFFDYYSKFEYHKKTSASAIPRVVKILACNFPGRFSFRNCHFLKQHIDEENLFDCIIFKGNWQKIAPFFHHKNESLALCSTAPLLLLELEELLLLPAITA